MPVINVSPLSVQMSAGGAAGSAVTAGGDPGSAGRMAMPRAAVPAGKVGGMDRDGGGLSVAGAARPPLALWLRRDFSISVRRCLLWEEQKGLSH